MTKVLLIMADELMARAYHARLTHTGWDVQARADAHDALLTARQWKPDVIVVDLILPGLHGIDVLKWLRDVPWLATVRVVLLVERTVLPETLREGQLWGADRHLFKDACSPADVVDCLTQLMLPSASALPSQN